MKWHNPDKIVPGGLHDVVVIVAGQIRQGYYSPRRRCWEYLGKRDDVPLKVEWWTDDFEWPGGGK